MSILEYLFWIIVCVGIVIVVYFVLHEVFGQTAFGLWEKEYAIRNFQPLIDLIQQYLNLNNEVYGQTATTTPAPATPSPNPQYLPQKAYIQVFPPDGIAVQPVQEQQSSLGSIDSVITALVSGGIAAGYTKFKTMQNEKANKETMAAEVKTKEQIGELARVTYENMPNKGNEVTDAPAIKLETLKEDKQETAEKAAKS